MNSFKLQLNAQLMSENSSRLQKIQNVKFQISLEQFLKVTMEHFGLLLQTGNKRQIPGGKLHATLC
jgi:hypothetical protein